MRRSLQGVVLVLAAFGAIASGAIPATPPTSLRPFKASYVVVWRGMNAGTTDLELTADGPNAYVYTSRANARGLFRVFFHDEITQTSWFTLNGAGVQPQRYRADDGSKDTERDIALDFEWRDRRVTGTAEEKKVDLELEPNAQDAMSIQIAHLIDLDRGVKDTVYAMVDKDRVKKYSYTYEGRDRLKTALGQLDTVIYRVERPNSKRVTRTWHATSLGYVPVRAERLRDGKREWLMEIRSLERS